MKQPLRIFLSAVFLFTFFHASTASSIDKAYRALKIYDYFTARKGFYKAIKKHPLEAGYGLSVLFYKTDNPFHNYDSAYKYIEVCRNNYLRLPSKERPALKNKYGINDTVIHNIRDSIQYKAFKNILVAVKRSSIAKLDSFIAFQSASLYLPEVLFLRDSSIFYSICLLNNSQAYEQYIVNYPESIFLQQVRLKLDKALYAEATPNHLPVEYEKFIHKYPKSTFITDAENNVFSFYLEKKDVKDLYKSIYKFPRNKNVANAWKLIYTLSVPEYSPQALNSFLEKYPDFPYKQTIEQEIALLGIKLYTIKQDGRYGFIDSTGTPYVLPYLDGVEEFSEGLCAAEFNGKFGYVNKAGEAVITFKYENAESFKRGLAMVQTGGKSAIIDRTGNYVALGYDDIADYSEGLAIVTKAGKQGAINSSGQLVIATAYDKIGDFSEGRAYILKNGKYGYIDKQSDLVIANLFEWAESFKNKLARVKFNNKYGVINNKGDFVLKPEYERIEEPLKNIFVLVKGIHYGFAESSGCMLTDIVFDYSSKLKVADLCDGKWLRIITEDDQNLMNLNGKKLFPEEAYEEVYLPKDGLIRFFSNDKYGFIDEHSKQVAIRPMYDEAGDFSGGIAVARKKDNVLLIDRNNKIIFSDKADDIEALDNNLFLITKGGLTGLVNKAGRLLLNCEFTNIEKTTSHLLMLEKQGKMAYYDPVRFDFIWKEKGFDNNKKME